MSLGLGRCSSVRFVRCAKLATEAGASIAMRLVRTDDDRSLMPSGERVYVGISVLGPVTTLNYGFAKDWELVVQGQLETALSSSESPIFSNAAVLLKNVLRPGSLHDKSGPSIATEFGVLLPDIGGDSGFGASWAGIVSQRYDWGTVHFNLQ